MPAGPAYGALLAELGPDVDARPKELEVYADEAPPPDYSLATEVAGITKRASSAFISSATRAAERRRSHSRRADRTGC